LRSSRRLAKHPKIRSDEKLSFQGMKIIMMQAIPACYRDIFDEREKT
jgi:hypothetical protein